MQHVARVCQRQRIHLLRYSEILVENRRFEPTPHPFRTPVGMIQLEFRRNLCRQQTRIHGLLYGVVCVILRLSVLVQYRRVTNKETDGRTHDDSIYNCTALEWMARHGKWLRYRWVREGLYVVCVQLDYISAYTATRLSQNTVKFAGVLTSRWTDQGENDTEQYASTPL